jgi:serine/threonine protein kinase
MHLQLLGKGNYGQVHLAAHGTVPVAVKVAVMTSDNNSAEEMFNEAYMMDRIDTPYSLRFHGALVIQLDASGQCLVPGHAGLVPDDLKKPHTALALLAMEAMDGTLADVQDALQRIDEGLYQELLVSTCRGCSWHLLCTCMHACISYPACNVRCEVMH